MMVSRRPASLYQVLARTMGVAAMLTGATAAGNAAPQASTDQVTHVRQLHNGQLSRTSVRHGGLRVVGGGIATRRDTRGSVLWQTDHSRAIPAQLELQATLTPDQAIARVVRSAGYPDAAIAGSRAELVVYAPPAGAIRLAYQVTLPPSPVRMEALLGYVDAHTGRVRSLANRIMTADAWVYEHNPVQTPELFQTELPGLPTQAPHLISGEVEARNCQDLGACYDFFGSWYHGCEIQPTVTPDGDGNYLHYTFEADVAADDTFAEVQAYYHAAKALEFARSLGFTGFADGAILIIANYRPVDDSSNSQCDGITYNGNAPLPHFDNAFFTAGGIGLFRGIEQDAIALGDGSRADFAYDGDVIYHELGHALMNNMAPELGHGYLDEFGWNPTPGGLHEGYADMFTLFVTDDPGIAEYAGVNLGDANADYLRTVDNSFACPGDLVGESHDDAGPITGALFEARTAIATTTEDKRRFDRALFTTQLAFDASTDYRGAAELTLLELEAEFGAETAAIAARIFADRGISDCHSRVADGHQVKHKLWLRSSYSSEEREPMPAPVQFHYELPEAAAEFVVTIEELDYHGYPESGTVEIAVKPGSDPIRWTEGGQLTGDYAATAPIILTETGGGTATLAGTFAAGSYHLQLLNRAGEVVVHEVTISHNTTSTSPDAGPVTPSVDAGATAPDSGTPPAPEPELNSGGCGCQTGRSGLGSGWGATAGLLLGALLLRRRRRQYCD